MANSALTGWWTSQSPEYQSFMAGRPDVNNLLANSPNSQLTTAQELATSDPFAIRSHWLSAPGGLMQKYGAADLAYNPQTRDYIGLDAAGNPIDATLVRGNVDQNFMRNAGLLMGAGYFGGGALANAFGGAGAAGAGVGAAPELSGWDAAMADVASSGAPQFASGAAAPAATPAATGGGWLSSLTGGAGGWEKALPYLGSAALNAYSANKAAGTQADAARYAADLQQQMFNKQIELQEPWRQAGVNALAKMGTGFTGQVDMTQDPGYAFRLAEGLKALDRQASARGGLLSGAALKGTQRYAQDYASQEYQNAFNRELAKYNTTAALANVGQTSANALTGAAGTYGANAAEATMQGANARASGYMGTTNALSNALSGYMNYQQGQEFLNYLKSKQPSPGGP